MDRKSVLLVILSLGVGGICGWFLNTNDHTLGREKQKNSENQAWESRPHSKLARPVAGPRQNIPSEEIDSLRKYWHQPPAYFDELLPEEKKSIIGILVQHSSPDEGLDWQNKELLQNLIQSLCRNSSPEEILAWASESFSEGVRAYIVRQTAGELMNESLSEALTLASSHLDQKEMGKLAGSALISQRPTPITNHDAALLIAHIGPGSNSFTSSVIKFSGDFDFEKFAALAMERQSSIPGRLSHFPSNLLKEWATRDVEGAMAFYDEFYLEQGKQLPSNDFAGLASGYIDSVSSAEGSAWLRDIMLSNDLPKQTRQPLIDNLASGNLSGPFRDELFSQIDDPAQKNQLAGEIFTHFQSRYGGRFGEAPTKILRLFPSPSSRLEFLRANYEISKRVSDPEKQLESLSSQLRILGHTQEEIQSVTERFATKP